MEGEKFNLGEKISARSSNLRVIGLHLCCRFCCELSRHTGLSLEHFAAVSSPNIAELVPSGFFCPQPWFLRRSEHKHFHVERQLDRQDGKTVLKTLYFLLSFKNLLNFEVLENISISPLQIKNKIVSIMTTP